MSTHAFFWAALIPLLPRESAAAKKLPCSCVRSAEPMLQLAYLKDRLHDLKYMLDNIPPQLRQWVAEDDDDALYGSSPEQQRIVKAQFATMRANIHVTHLWLQSLIRDQVDALLLGQPNPPDLKSTWSEREDICRQFLHVLHSIPHISLEPNGLHFTYKVRDVAVSLLTCPFESYEEASKRASEYLRDFTNKLSRLDASETMNTLSLQSWIDTDRRKVRPG